MVEAALNPAVEAATAQQRRAADPEASAWVDANAGSGKTKVLADRVLALLLRGVPPERILCLTYTRAAAAEMRIRIERELAGWATAPDEELDTALVRLGRRGSGRRRAEPRPPPFRPHGRCAGRASHRHDPRLLPEPARALPHRSRRVALVPACRRT